MTNSGNTNDSAGHSAARNTLDNTEHTSLASTPSLDAAELTASLTVANLDTSLAWYTDILGCTIDRKHEFNGAVRAISLRAGTVRLLITQDNGAQGERAKGQGFSLQLTTRQDIDAIANRIKASGGVLLTEPADAFGGRVFRIADPDGFKFVIASVR